MRTYERNGVHIEQCEGCRGVFLDFGELEHLTALEARSTQPAPQHYGQVPPQQYGQMPPQQYSPAWGNQGGHDGHGGHKNRRGGFSGLFFSS